LGEAYRIKLEGNRHENLQKAVEAYDKAIQEFLMHNPNQRDSRLLEMYKKNRSLAQKELGRVDELRKHNIYSNDMDEDQVSFG
jgi:hypothetical protein